MKCLLFVFTFVLSSLSIAQAQDKIYKSTGEVLETKVLEIGPSEIRYKVFANQSGPIYALTRAEAIKVVYENGTIEHFGLSDDSLNPANIYRSQNLLIEFGGQGILLSINYDTRFGKSRNGLGGRIGFGAASSELENVTLFTIPISLNYLIGKRNHFFEIGLGATYADFSKVEEIYLGPTDLIGTMAFMYRLQPMKKEGFLFRAGFTPIFSSSAFKPYAGFSFGITL